MKVIFLDMDGVLNSHAHMTERNRLDPQHEARGDFELKDPRRWVPMVDFNAVLRLNRILKETGAKIVISSSWRHAHPHETGRMQKILDFAGMEGGDVIDETPVMNGPRAHEIASWLAANAGVRRFVILDDGASAGEGLGKWFVHTDLAVGLTDADVKKAINILGRR